VTHVRSFNEYVDDLERFVSKEVAPRVRATRAQGDTTPKSDKIVYVANSVAGEYV
jgi:alpha-beta hydrolase superfamily lysophospholipase